LYLAPLGKQFNGAEESDIECGQRILMQFKDISVHYAYLDITSKKFNSMFNFYANHSNTNILDKLYFAWHSITSPDYTLRQGYTFENFIFIKRICEKYQIDLIFTNTSSTFLFGRQKGRRHIHRSVCFEPFYVLRSVSNSIKSRFHSFLKLFTVLKELQADGVAVISPRDQNYYELVNKLLCTKTKIEVIPLRQFYFPSNNLKRIKSISTISIAFLGSTYNVLHNMKSLEFMVTNLDENFLETHNFYLNLYGSKFPNSIQDSDRIKTHKWVKDINEIYSLNTCFVVPYFLNSGMQSKVFEPLINGRILICDPRTLSNYDFRPFKHFIPAVSGDDFKSALVWVKNNREASLKIGEAALLESRRMIGRDTIHATLNKLLYLNSLNEK